jgi:fructuronate reductase
MTPVRLDRSSWDAPPRPVRIVHIGVGNFSRAHQAWYTAQADPAGKWGIVGFTGRGAAVADALGRQGGLFTLIERGPAVDRLEVIDSICDVRPASDLAGLTAAIAAPETAVVTLTVTEAGYAASPPAGGLPPIPERLVTALVARRDAGCGPLAIVSCDNISANGTVLRDLTLAAAAPRDFGVRAWIESEISFVSTSVDRITPRTTDADRLLVQHELKLVDDAPVVCEPFTDWVLCGDFPAGRPSWEDAGARFVPDIEPWELRKLWLLNGGHSLLSYCGLLRGHATVADAADDPELDAALERFWDLAERYLPAGASDLRDYRRDLKERFANARISYPLTQIATDGLGKLRNRVVPVIKAAIAAGEAPEPALQVIAAWAHWLDGISDVGEIDASAAELRRALASTGGEDRIRALLELLAPGWGADHALVAASLRLQRGLGGQRAADPSTKPHSNS